MSGRRLTPVAGSLAAAVALATIGAGAASHASAAGTAPAATTKPAAAKATTKAAAKAVTGLDLIRQRHVLGHKAGHAGPVGPNPWLAEVPSGQVQDWGGWRRAMKKQAAAKATARAAAQKKTQRAGAALLPAPPTPVIVREDEPRGTRGANDSFRSAQPLPLGTAKGKKQAVTVLGRLSPAAVPELEAQPPNVEPDDTLPTARDTGVSTVRKGFSTTGSIVQVPANPDDPFASDLDLYKVTLKQGELLHVDLKKTGGDLVPFADLVDAKGRYAAFSDDDFESTSTLDYVARKAGTYYVVTGGYLNIDFDDEDNLVVTQTTGTYDIGINARQGDRDLFKVSLTAGDVLGGTVDEAARYISVFDAKGVERHGSPVDYSGIYPIDSPLPGGGNAATDFVVPTSGTYYLEVTDGDGAYESAFEVYRYGGAAKKQTQTIYLDFDGQRVNTGVWGGRGVTKLSPLSSFLGAWGIPRASEKALINRIKANVQENLIADLKASGLNKLVDVKVVTSLDGADPFGKAGVTRVIVGGTIEESGIGTIGIAQSIDPGNYEREETALVLLDVLSGDPDDYGDASLLSYLKPSSNRLAFVAQGVGNVTSHEIGHMIGNWHTDNTNTRANLMDAGGEGFERLFGVGKDGIGGTKDDVDVDFVTDEFSPYEGFTGFEDTRAISTWGMSSK